MRSTRCGSSPGVRSGGAGRSGWALGLAVAVVTLAATAGVLGGGCVARTDQSAVQRCYDASGSCNACCELLSGMTRIRCLDACECKRTCCLEEAGSFVPGQCGSCRAAVEEFHCEPDKARDSDGDGFTFYDGDCDDDDPEVNPTMLEVANGIDDDCDGWTDEDLDHDGWAEAEGDCDDSDPEVNPYAREVCGDGVDNDCNGYTDGQEPDVDGDRFGPCTGDCDDSDARINVGSAEDATDMVDNNCNGLTDEPRVGCDCGPLTEGPEGFLEAIELCNWRNQVLDVQTRGNPAGMAIMSSFGAVVRRTAYTHPEVEELLDQNCRFIILCTGPAASIQPQGGRDMDLGTTDPEPLQSGEQAYDMVQLFIQFLVPGNARGFSFDFIYLSSEYPEYLCSPFNDTFYAIEQDSAVNGGRATTVSYDADGNAITVNTAFFENPNFWTQSLAGTGYDQPDPGDSCGWGVPVPGCIFPDPCPPLNNTVGSSTGWLRTISPVTPGGVSSLTFSIHDEGDHVLDSCVIIDNFRWLTTPVGDPQTVK